MTPAVSPMLSRWQVHNGSASVGQVHKAFLASQRPVGSQRLTGWTPPFPTGWTYRTHIIYIYMSFCTIYTKVTIIYEKQTSVERSPKHTQQSDKTRDTILIIIKIYSSIILAFWCCSSFLIWIIWLSKAPELPELGCNLDWSTIPGFCGEPICDFVWLSQTPHSHRKAHVTEEHNSIDSPAKQRKTKQRLKIYLIQKNKPNTNKGNERNYFVGQSMANPKRSQPCHIPFTSVYPVDAVMPLHFLTLCHLLQLWHAPNTSNLFAGKSTTTWSPCRVQCATTWFVHICIYTKWHIPGGLTGQSASRVGRCASPEGVCADRLTVGGLNAAEVEGLQPDAKRSQANAQRLNLNKAGHSRTLSLSLSFS